MDTKRELAESLPLCLGNEDYLKDFQPLSSKIWLTILNFVRLENVFDLVVLFAEDERERVKEPPKVEEPAKIKVVHFGLL